jgi:hypothetical protein
MAGYQEPQQERKKSKWMWGCCGGCAGVALVAAIAAGVFLYFLFRSRPVAPPETFFNTGADAMAVLQVRPENQAMANMLRQLAANPPEAMDLTPEERQQLQSQAEQLPANLEGMTPVQLVLLARHLEEPVEAEEPPEGGEMEAVQDLTSGIGKKKRFEYAGAAAIKPYSGIVRWIVSTLIKSYPEKGGRTETYQGVTLGVPPSEKFYLAAKDNNFLFAEKKDLITGWIDAIDEQKNQPKKEGEQALPPYKGPEALKAMYERLDRRSPLYFATSNAHGEIGDFADMLTEVKTEGEDKSLELTLKSLAEIIRAAGADSEEVEALGGSFSLSDPDTARIEIYAECAGADSAQALSTRLEDAIRKSIEGAENVSIEQESREDLAHVTITIQKVQEALRAAGKEQQPQEEGNQGGN